MLVVVTNQCIDIRGNEIANIEAIGIECTSVIKAVEFLFHISEGDQPIAIEGPAVGDRFCVNGDLVEKDRLLIKDRDVGISIPGFDGAGVVSQPAFSPYIQERSPFSQRYPRRVEVEKPPSTSVLMMLLSPSRSAKLTLTRASRYQTLFSPTDSGRKPPMPAWLGVPAP